MGPIKTFNVFGERVDLLVSGEMTGGLSATIVQTSPPGGGPPPHRHTREDETFYVLEGQFEFLKDGAWHPVAPAEAVYAARGSVHSFRNCGQSDGKILITVTPSGLEKYFEEISPLSPEKDMPWILAITERYGITFVQ